MRICCDEPRQVSEMLIRTVHHRRYTEPLRGCLTSRVTHVDLVGAYFARALICFCFARVLNSAVIVQRTLLLTNQNLFPVVFSLFRVFITRPALSPTVDECSSNPTQEHLGF